MRGSHAGSPSAPMGQPAEKISPPATLADLAAVPPTKVAELVRGTLYIFNSSLGAWRHPHEAPPKVPRRRSGGGWWGAKVGGGARWA